MNFPVMAHSEPRPMALTLSQYAEFEWCFLENANYESLLEQKTREEIIVTPFSLRVNEGRDYLFRLERQIKMEEYGVCRSIIAEKNNGNYDA